MLLRLYIVFMLGALAFSILRCHRAHATYTPQTDKRCWVREDCK